MSEEPPPMKKEIKLWLGAAIEEAEENRISLSAYTVWSSFSDTIPRLYNSGLHFINPSENAMDRIQKLIDTNFQ